MKNKVIKFGVGDHVIYYGDVIKCFRKVSDNSVDLVFADPPYNIGKDFDGIPDTYDETEYKKWMKEWTYQIDRVLKPNGTVYLMNSTQNFADMDLICRKYFTVLSRIVWAYDSSGVQAKKKFGSSWEPILHMVKNEKHYTFNHKEIMVEAKTGSKRKLIDYRKTPPQPYNTKKVPSNVWDFSRVRFKMDEYENHPTQKPVKLLERIILASSNEKDVVLDPFGGSFTTGEVSKRLNRKFIGFDLNIEYVKIGIRRMNIESPFSEEELEKKKVKKTKNKSKRDHTQNQDLFENQS
jgi:site-specific DNA-methyltransferase (adenine-specific)/adenine-specific DNA-methyltransferase